MYVLRYVKLVIDHAKIKMCLVLKNDYVPTNFKDWIFHNNENLFTGDKEQKVYTEVLITCDILSPDLLRTFACFKAESVI